MRKIGQVDSDQPRWSKLACFVWNSPFHSLVEQGITRCTLAIGDVVVRGPNFRKLTLGSIIQRDVFIRQKSKQPRGVKIRSNQQGCWAISSRDKLPKKQTTRVNPSHHYSVTSEKLVLMSFKIRLGPNATFETSACCHVIHHHPLWHPYLLKTKVLQIDNSKIFLDTWPSIQPL